MDDCVLCHQDGGEVLWRDASCRVVLPSAAEVAGLCRVILGAHVAEMHALAPAVRRALFDVVVATEGAVAAVLAPDKVNLASLGNMVPHLHWHVIPRWRDDAWFPAAIWAPPVRPPRRGTAPADLAARLAAALRATLGPPLP